MRLLTSLLRAVKFTGKMPDVRKVAIPVHTLFYTPKSSPLGKQVFSHLSLFFNTTIASRTLVTNTHVSSGSEVVAYFKFGNFPDDPRTFITKK